MSHVSNLDDKVREQLRNRIASGELGGGSHLSELKLSKEFSVSRTPIREALCALAADGLIEMVPHRGAFVRTVTASEQADQMYIYAQMMGIAARMASERGGIETIMDMETTLSFMNTNDQTAFTKAVSSMNTLIRTTAQSPALESAIVDLERRMMGNIGTVSDTEVMASIKQEYTYLLGAVKRKKPDAAEKTMRGLMAMFSTPSAEGSEINMAPQTGANTTTSATSN